MFTDISPKDEKIYLYLRVETHKARTRIKMTVDYYAAMATKYRMLSVLFNAVCLISSCSAAYLIVVQNFPLLAGFLALIASVSTVVNVVGQFEISQSRFLMAQHSARELEQRIDNLWVGLDSELFLDLPKIKEALDNYGHEYQRVEQMVQPYSQNKKLALKIQDRIETGLREGSYNERQNEEAEQTRTNTR